MFLPLQAAPLAALRAELILQSAKTAMLLDGVRRRWHFIGESHSTNVGLPAMVTMYRCSRKSY